MLLGAVNEAEGFLHGGFAGFFVPGVFDDVAVFGEPAGGAEHRRDADPHAAVGEQVEPAGVGHRQVGQGGDAREQEFAERDAHAGGDLFALGAENGEVFVERGVVESGRADLVREPLVHRLARGVGMDVDQARHDHAAGAVVGGVGGVGVVAADISDAAVGEGDVGAGHVGVGGAVPGDGEVGVADQGGWHGGASGV